MKPAVLFVHSNSELYGADLILWQTIKAIKDDVRPFVALPGEGPLGDRLRREGAEVILTRDSMLRRINFKPSKMLPFILDLLHDVAQLRKLILKEEIKLVYCNTSAVVSGALAARRCQIANIYHVHEIIQHPPWLAKAIARLTLGNSSEVIAVSQAVADSLLRFGKPGDPPVRVIHNGLDPAPYDAANDVEILRGQLGAGPKNILFGVIGRIHPWKGQSYFIQAARLVADVCPQARFVIVGGTFSGYEHLLDELNQQVQRLALRDRLKILPFRDDVPQLMKALDVFVLPSTSPDPLPTVVLEAMAASRPVVATAHGGALEMVLHGETGLLAPHDDVAAFSEALLQLSAEASLRHSLGGEGRRRLEEQFNLPRFQESIRERILAYVPKKTALPAANLEPAET
jgi:glycosyltransferase involved in cell wall biosynthesis